MSKVLLVDDDAPALELRKLILEREGHEVSIATDPTQARALFLATPPDYIVLDLRLPEANVRPLPNPRFPQRRAERPHHRPLRMASRSRKHP